MRVPFQVYLDRPLATRLARAAKRRATSQAKLVRAWIEQGLADDEFGLERAMRIVGIGSSGIRDMAIHHDRYLEEEIYRRKMGRPLRK